MDGVVVQFITPFSFNFRTFAFMLTNKGIEANPDKCRTFIDMRSPTSVKEVQQLTGRIAALSRFLSCAGEKAFHFFSTLRKSERFIWNTQCEEAFHKLKTFLASPSILTHPEKGNTLYLYLTVSEEKPIYFVSRTFKGAEAKYQKIEKLSLAVIATARKLRRYFQSHKVVVKTSGHMYYNPASSLSAVWQALQEIPNRERKNP
jgi:hypothetical protein